MFKNKIWGWCFIVYTQHPLYWTTNCQRLQQLKTIWPALVDLAGTDQGYRWILTYIFVLWSHWNLLFFLIPFNAVLKLFWGYFDVFYRYSEDILTFFTVISWIFWCSLPLIWGYFDVFYRYSGDILTFFTVILRIFWCFLPLFWEYFDVILLLGIFVILLL